MRPKTRHVKLWVILTCVLSSSSEMFIDVNSAVYLTLSSKHVSGCHVKSFQWS